MSVKLSNLQLLYGVAGGREKFEELVSQLIHAENPGSNRIRVVVGDEGIDSFEGNLTDPAGIDVYQVKYFIGGIGDSQKTQIRGSFASVRDSDKVKARSWTLCLPIDMGLDEREWFERWATKQKDSDIEIRPVWGELHIEGLLLQDKHRSIREAFFKQEHLEILRQQSGTLEKLLHEFTTRIQTPTPEVLSLTFLHVQARNAYRWDEDKMVVEIQFVYKVHNIGKKAVSKWKVGGRIDALDPELEKRLVNPETFPRLGTRGIPMDTTILPTLSETAWQTIGVMIRRSESFQETLRKTLDSYRLTFWAITDDGPGEEKTVNLVDRLDWASLLPSFKSAYLLALGRLEAID